MQTTETELKSKKEKSVPKKGAVTHSSESGETSALATKQESGQLSKNLAQQLMGLIDKVNADGVTPESVNASCNAAAQIYKILRLNFEMKKEGF
jgi:hypothetical protein